MTALILFNPHAGDGTAGRETRNLSKMLLGDSLKYQDMTEIDDYAKLFAGLDPETRIILSGGDGTLNEVASGAAGFENAAVTVFSGGSGYQGDTIRYLRLLARVLDSLLLRDLGLRYDLPLRRQAPQFIKDFLLFKTR